MWSIQCVLLFLLSRVKSQEVSTPSSLLKPRNFNHHPFDAVQFLKNLNIEPTKQGPVLFPNDAPPPPRPPLVVTSRPLVESIARSELGANNTETSQSQINRVSFVPYLARVKDYRPFIPSPSFDYNLPTPIPYTDFVKKSILVTDNRYNDYEEQTALPPIYKALANHAKQNVLKHDKLRYDQHLYQPEYHPQYKSNEINEETDSQYDHNKNYAFSYTVKDHATGDDFSHSQQSSGSATNGEYRVRLPDGRMQIVSYTADENGYKADVRYDELVNSVDDYNDKTVYRNHNDRNDFKNYHDLKTQTDFKDDLNGLNDFKNADYQNHQDYKDYKIQSKDFKIVDFIDRNKKGQLKPVSENDDYYYPDVSKEFYNDYSSEYNNNFQPHKSKFNFNDKFQASTVKPSYEELKDLLVTKDAYKTEQNYDNLKVSSTTPSPFEGTTEHVVLITSKTPNLYTNIKNSIPNLGYGVNPRVIAATTPRSYLVSTIASLKNRIHFAKPQLSDSYVDKINKYLKFN